MGCENGILYLHGPRAQRVDAVDVPGATPPDRRPASGPGLVRIIGRWDLTAAVINAVIGSSIFGMPAELARLTGQHSPLVALIAGIGVLAIVLCFAEVASRFQEPGGPYLYARAAFGSFIGFEAGWLTFWIRVTAMAANLNVFTEYLGRILPAAASGPLRALVMTVVVAVIAGINLRGVRQATWAVDLFTLAKLLPLVLLVVVGLPQVKGAVLQTQQVADPQWSQAILLLLFAYGGFEAPLIPAGEARNPRRDSAFALLSALAVIATLYCFVQLAVVGLVPAVALVKAPVAAAFGVLLGGSGVVLASVAAMVSISGYATGTVLQSPRVLFSMAERGELPAALARIHPRFRTPHVAILTYATLALALALFGSFTWNATVSAIVRLLTYGLTCVALLVLRGQDRRAGPSPPAGFRLPAAALLAPAAAGFCLWLLATRPLRQAWLVLVLVVVGALLWRRRRATA
jgi:basic amino acid/polyamine antiporter, APA family